jgi:hypothetical protein
VAAVLAEQELQQQKIAEPLVLILFLALLPAQAAVAAESHLLME